jgi:hypothetical protein
MKYFLLSIGVMIGSGLLLGTLAHEYVAAQIREQESRSAIKRLTVYPYNSTLSPKEKYCQQQTGWHPDCNLE